MQSNLVQGKLDRDATKHFRTQRGSRLALLLEEMSALAAAAGNVSGRKTVSRVLAAVIGLISLAAAGPLASPALAASGPQVTITCTGTNSCTAIGTGFTPSGRVMAEAFAGSSEFSSINLTASAPTLVCFSGGLKPVCHDVGGGSFTTVLPVDYSLACDATSGGTAEYIDVSTDKTVSKPVTWTGACIGPTTTTLTLPSTADTSWTSGINPARVNAGSTLVTSGTITVTVNGLFFCQYSAGAASGCTTVHLPAGTDQVEASYSGSTEPPYYPSSASATVTVLPVDPSTNVTTPNWAGYVATSDTYTAASASWTVPTANCNFGTVSTSATWVGIDGWNTSTVEQIGTDSNCTFFGTEYHAWVQMYPSSPQPIQIPTLSSKDVVYAGDYMKASVTSTGVPGWYTLSITDDTQGWTYATTQSNPTALGGTAECIEEQPSFLSIQLTSFGSVTFNQCRFTGSDGIATPIWDHPNQAVDMTNGSTPKASVSPLSDDGTTFTVTFQSN